MTEIETAQMPLPTDKYGPCPKCGAASSTIIWGWHGVNYDLQCPNGHLWTYKFPKVPP